MIESECEAMTITDKYGLVHPKEEVRRVVARLSHRDPLRGERCWPRPATPSTGRPWSEHWRPSGRCWALPAPRGLLGREMAGRRGRGRRWGSGWLWEPLRKWNRRNWPTSRLCGAGNAWLCYSALSARFVLHAC